MLAGKRWLVPSKPKKGRRLTEEFEEQPHAKQIANAPEPEMRSTDAQREVMPITRDEE
jgi:hypothetical protein